MLWKRLSFRCCMGFSGCAVGVSGGEEYWEGSAPLGNCYVLFCTPTEMGLHPLRSCCPTGVICRDLGSVVTRQGSWQIPAASGGLALSAVSGGWEVAPGHCGNLGASIRPQGHLCSSVTMAWLRFFRPAIRRTATPLRNLVPPSSPWVIQKRGEEFPSWSSGYRPDQYP